MAGGGSSNEINPFISYVDLFSAVILVLLLFMLLLMVNVGYYMQFNTKNHTQDKDNNMTTTATQADMLKSLLQQVQEKKEELERVQQIKTSQATTNPDMIEPSQPMDANSSQIGNGAGDEKNIVRNGKQSTPITLRSADLIVFQTNGMLVAPEMLSQTIQNLQGIVKQHPNAQFYLSVGDSKKIVTQTQAKQLSLGRLLDLKNKLSAADGLKNKIKIDYQHTNTLEYEYGYVKIDVK